MPLNPTPAPDSTQSRIIRMTDKEFAELTTLPALSSRSTAST